MGAQSQTTPPLGGGRWWGPPPNFKKIFLIFLKSVGYVSNNVAGVSGGSKRIKNFFMIFEKKYFLKIFFKKSGKNLGRGGE